MIDYTQALGLALRENNTKRNFLVVNRFQGKHYPMSPKGIFALFDQLANKLPPTTGETLYIGFAETATAIGARVAVVRGGYYLQTTREPVENVSFLPFSEEHSHATEQNLVKEDFEEILPKLSSIVFVEDEVSTGNTILNIIRLLEQHYDNLPPFSVLSLFNFMNDSHKEAYAQKNIALHWLLEPPFHPSTFEERAVAFRGDGVYHPQPKTPSAKPSQIFSCEKDYVNTRRLTTGKDYENACFSLWSQIQETDLVNSPAPQRILLLGTEEFMYPPLFLGKKLEELGHTVCCHATTRSPIGVSTEEGYPLEERWALPSFYQLERNSFVYNLADYDRVIICTDSKDPPQESLSALCQALVDKGNDSIFLLQWKSEGRSFP